MDMEMRRLIDSLKEEEKKSRVDLNLQWKAIGIEKDEGGLRSLLDDLHLLYEGGPFFHPHIPIASRISLYREEERENNQAHVTYSFQVLEIGAGHHEFHVEYLLDLSHPLINFPLERNPGVIHRSGPTLASMMGTILGPYYYDFYYCQDGGVDPHRP